MPELPKILSITLPGGVPLEFRWIPACREGFRMGSRGNYEDEEPVHRVVIPHSFYLGTFPVTQAQYREMSKACHGDLKELGGNGDIDPSDFKGHQRPVENVSWDEAMMVARWLSRSDCLREALLREGLPPEVWRAGLPGEAMWEYACRSGTETEYWRGDGETALAEVGWYVGNSDRKTHPAGDLANDFGLHDMHGNVCEWCADAWHEGGYRHRADGVQAGGASNEARLLGDDRNRVLRGGCWYYPAWNCRSADRYRDWPGLHRWYFGFRLCLFPGPGENGRQAEPATGAKARRDDAAVAEVAGGAELRTATFPPRGGDDEFPQTDPP